MKKNRTCPHCHNEFENIEGHVFSNHVRWCHDNPRHEELCGKTLADKIVNKRNGILKEFTVICESCKDDFTVIEREKTFPSKERYFCSKSCAAKYASKFTDIEKIRQGVNRFIDEHCGEKRGNIIIRHAEKEIRKCPECGEDFEVLKRLKKRFCSPSCASIWRERERLKEILPNLTDSERYRKELKIYRSRCVFTFSLKAFPDEFDFGLVEKYGWYSASNRGNNLTGVSRDHMFSVKDGFIRGVDPSIISHPANCRLILQSENASKHDSSIITLDELMQRISDWDEKYNTIR